MRVTLIRHGEVEERYAGCYNGHLDIALSPSGREQARRLAAHLDSEAFDAVCCSDLRRARETLAPFKISCEPFYTAALREKSWGRHEGMNYDAIVASEEVAYESFEQWLTHLDGEPYPDFVGRIRRFFLEELARRAHRNVLVITHAGVVRTLMHLVKKIPLEEAFATPFPYGACVELDLEKGRFGEVLCVG